MPRATHTTSIKVDLSELDQDDLKKYMQATYSPGDVFEESELGEWATGNGYAKENQ